VTGATASSGGTALRTRQVWSGISGRAGGAVRTTAVVIAAVVLAFLLVAPVLALGHLSPLEVYRQLVLGAVGSPAVLGSSLLYASPLILIGLGVALSMRAGFLNIGGQGQLYVGAVAATWFVLTAHSLPASLLVLGSAVISAVAGGLWALLAGLARVFRGANEVVTTLLLNYVAVGVVDLLVYKPLRQGDAAFPQTAQIPAGAVLPTFDVDGVSVGLGVVVGVVLAFAAAAVLRWTALGYEVRAMSTSLAAARYAGIRVRRHLLASAFVGGGLAGIAGAFEVMGVQLRLTPDFFAPEVAFTGVLVALLGGGRPIGVVVAGLFMGALTNGGTVMQQATSAPSVMVYVLEALVLLFILTGVQWSSRGGLGGLRQAVGRARARRALAVPPKVSSFGGSTAPDEVQASDEPPVGTPPHARVHQA
jgi:general nucleoside transport system permease protein